MPDNQSVDELTAITTLASDDTFYAMSDPTGARSDRKLAAAVMRQLTFPVWFPFVALSTGAGGTPASSQAGAAVTDRVRFWLMDPASSEGLTGSWHVPDFGVATINVRLRWLPTTTGAGNVAWRLSHGGAAVGESAITGTITESIVTSAAGGVANVMNEVTLKSGIAVTPDDLFRFVVERVGGDGSDTYAADAGALGVLIDWAS